MELFSPINRAGGSGSGSITVPGSDTQVIFNDGGVLGADAGLTYNKTSNILALGTTGATGTGYLQVTSGWDGAGSYPAGTSNIRYGAFISGKMNDTIFSNAGSATYYGIRNLFDIPSTNAKVNNSIAYGVYTEVKDSSVIDETVYAKNALKLSSTQNVTAGETVTINGKVYTFVATPSTEGDVKLGANGLTSFQNLMAAINYTGTPGTDYFCASANSDVEAISIAPTSGVMNMSLQARTIGSAGDSITLTEGTVRITASYPTFRRAIPAFLSGMYGGRFDATTGSGGQPQTMYGGLFNVTHGSYVGNSSNILMVGVQSQVQVIGTVGVDPTHTRGDVYGFSFNPNIQGGRVGNLYGYHTGGAGSFDALASVGNWYGFYAQAPNGAAACVIDALYGLYIADQTATSCTATAKYNIYSAGATAENYIAGNLTVIGTLTATVPAPVIGNDTQIIFNDTGALAANAEFTYTKTSAILGITRTVDDTAGPQLVFTQSRGASGQDADVLGSITFNGYNDANTPAVKTYGTIVGSIVDASDGTEDGKIATSVLANGSLQTIIQMYHVSSTGSYFELIPPEGTGRLKVGGAALNTAGALWLDSNGGSAEFAFSNNNFGSYGFQIIYAYGNGCTHFYDTVAGLGDVFVVKSGAIGFFANQTQAIVGTTGAKVISVKNTGVSPTAVCADFVQTWCKDYASGDARLYMMGESSTDNLIFGGGKIQINNVPANDTSATGITTTGTAGESLAFGDVCYLGTDSWYYKSDATSASSMQMLGVVIATGTIGASATGEFLEFGYARKDAWNWTPGGLLYADATTPGAMTHTPPATSGDQVQIVGYAYGTDVVKFMPQLITVEVA